MPAATLIEIGLEKYDWQLRRKYSWKKWLSKGGESSGRKVANPREGILMAIVATFVKEIYFSGWFSENSCTADSKYVPNLGHAMYLFYTTGLRSWNMTFLGVRSPNPLPKASGLGNLTNQTMLLSSIPSSSKHHRRNIKTFIKFSCLDGSKVDALFSWFCHRWGQVSLLRPFLSRWEWGGLQVTSQSIWMWRPQHQCVRDIVFYTTCFFLSW